ncbi:MAG: MotA/TolQ/ExbB proton channel family protein [Gammaproteobacteria bacterium]|nr:MotA/TolQ/ExbB proton channel family protein [Gammaproteobacteria bacterium]
MSEMGLANLIAQADAVALVVLAILFIMSASSWYYIAAKSIRIRTATKYAYRAIDEFWNTPNLRDAITVMEKQPASEACSKIALDCANAALQHAQNKSGRLGDSMSRADFVERALRYAVARETARLENGLTLLATVGSISPFVGLFGTVWGIYHALVKIGASGEASLDVVAGPVGEALIMTAIGLAVAVPAVLGYNFIIRSNRKIIAVFDAFANDLHSYFTSDANINIVGALSKSQANPAAPAARPQANPVAAVKPPAPKE